ncbi:hypothetical protein D9M68_615140 [compost metagenome]
MAHGARRTEYLLGLQGVTHRAQLPVDLGAGQARGVGHQAQGVALGLQRLDRLDRSRQGLAVLVEYSADIEQHRLWHGSVLHVVVAPRRGRLGVIA